jgi:hypothetical protein
MSRRSRIAMLVAALGCAVTVAGCGAGASSYSASGSAESSADKSDAVGFSVCMRADGVPNFPDPTGSGAINIPDNSGINPESPAFLAARGKCSHLLPRGGPPHGPPSEKAKLAMLKVSECMRGHGVTGFPDPTLKAPSNPADYGEMTDDAGVVLAIPITINVQSPAYRKAANACNFH